MTTGLRLRVQFHFVVKDAIDFCPGNMVGSSASYITIPLSRLEASRMALRCRSRSTTKCPFSK